MPAIPPAAPDASARTEGAALAKLRLSLTEARVVPFSGRGSPTSLLGAHHHTWKAAAPLATVDEKDATLILEDGTRSGTKFRSDVVRVYPPSALGHQQIDLSGAARDTHRERQPALRFSLESMFPSVAATKIVAHRRQIFAQSTIDGQWSYFHRVEASSSKVRWTFAPKDEQDASFTDMFVSASGGLLVVTEHGLAHVDGESGAELWHRSATEWNGSAPRTTWCSQRVVASRPAIELISGEHFLPGGDRHDPEVRASWLSHPPLRWTTIGPEGKVERTRCLPECAQVLGFQTSRQVLLGTSYDADTLVAIDTRERVKNIPLGGVIAPLTFAQDTKDNSYFVVTSGQGVEIVSLAAHLNPRWRVSLEALQEAPELDSTQLPVHLLSGGPSLGNPTSLMVAGDTLLVECDRGLVAVSLANGEPRWLLPARPYLRFVGADGTIYGQCFHIV